MMLLEINILLSNIIIIYELYIPNTMGVCMQNKQFEVAYRTYYNLIL